LQSETNFHQELPGKDDYIIPAEYYDRYRLVFSHYHLDRKLVRIGSNGRQRKATEGRLTDSSRSGQEMDDPRYSIGEVSVSRETDYLQKFQTLASKISQGQRPLN
jgi:hypothetical protein